MRAIRLAMLTLGLIAVGSLSFPSQGATLSIDAREQPPAPEIGYLHLGSSVTPDGHAIGINNRYLTLDGKPWLPVMGEFHYTRFPNRYWEDELRKMKAAGVSIVSTYIFWNHHEEKEGQFIWSQDRDLRRFVTLCGQIGLKVMVRPGPWVHSESRFGGIPDWVVSAMPTRGNDPVYLRYVARYWTEVSRQLKGLLWKDGGPVIGMQLENEYYRTGPGQGREHIAALKRIALEAGLDVPLYTVTGWDNTVFPDHDVVPLQGGYADQPWGLTTDKLPPSETYAFRFITRVSGNLAVDPAHPTDSDATAPHTPFLGAEFGGGVPTMYRRRPIMMPDDVAAMLPVELGSGVNLYGYYMFHGGQNSPDHDALQESTAIGAYNDLPMIDYDFQAPLGAYGQQHPVLNAIRPIHYFLQVFGESLAPMTVHRPSVLPTGSGDLTTPRYSVRSLGDTGFLFVSNYVRQYKMAVQKDVQFSVALPHETVTLPSRPMDIPSGAYFIWPINMDLSGARLIYATAQPVTRIAVGAVPVYVFRAQDGVPAEFAISSDGIADVTASTGAVVRNAAGNRFLVSDIQAGTGAGIEIRKSNGGTVRVLILTTAQIGRMSLVGLGGHPHLVLTEAQLFSDRNGLVLLSTGEPDFKLSIFPALSGPLLGNLAIRQTGRDGSFAAFEASAPRRTIPVVLTRIRDAKSVPPLAMTGPGQTAVEPAPETFASSAAWTIAIPAGALNGLEDGFLRIDAKGDVARLFSGVTILDDQFLEGRVWEVGLKRFPREIETPLTLTVLPMRRDAPIYLDAGVGAMVSGDQTADVVEVSVVPQYALHLHMGGHAPRKSRARPAH